MKQQQTGVVVGVDIVEASKTGHMNFTTYESGFWEWVKGKRITAKDRGSRGFIIDSLPHEFLLAKIGVTLMELRDQWIRETSDTSELIEDAK